MSERNTLIVGGGGREHQLGLSLANTGGNLYFTPGNAGTAEIGTNLTVKATDLEGIAKVADEKDCDLVVVGPEQPLVNGIANKLEGRPVFGPNPEAARLEGSKIFAVQFMREFDIPHPNSDIFGFDEDKAKLLEHLPPVSAQIQKLVFKADGLAGGKGAILPNNYTEATNALHGMFSGKMFGDEGKDIVLQERLHGPEVSVFVVCDGERYVTLPYSQDHKRLLDGDNGPNTGGMGAYAPVPNSIVNFRQQARIDEIVEKSIKGAEEWGMPYKGVLYIGMMLAEEYDDDPVVIEYNVRFGDPEAQVVLPLLDRAGVDVYDLLSSSAEGRLRTDMIPEIGSVALTYCLAAKGYPDSPKKGDPIHGLDKEYPGVIIQHGGTKRDGDQIVTAGGRVVFVTGLSESGDFNEASDNALAAIGKYGIHFDGMQQRKDIGHQVRLSM